MGPDRRRNRMLVAFTVIGLFLLAGTLTGGGGERASTEVSLDRLEAFIMDGRVVEATIRQDANVVEGTLLPGTLSEGQGFEVRYPEGFEGDLTALLLDSGTPTTVEVDGTSLLSVLVGLLPLLLIVGLFVFILRRAGRSMGGVLSFRKAAVTPNPLPQNRVTFADVAGIDEAVDEIREIKDFLQSPAKFRNMGARIPKGVLLAGPPGTGKTLLARAVAGEAGVPFFPMSGSDFVEMFVGVGASRVRDLFARAKAAAPAIVFIDELDAVGRHRGAGLGGGNDEREQTLNQLLVALDGFDVATGVVVIAATNRPDVLDPALLRPGRFDRQIVVDRPDLKGRIDILRVHAAGKPLAPEVDLETIARRTPGFTGADLHNVLNEALLLAARHGKSEVGLGELELAVDKLVAGPERRSRLLSAEERRVIAFHEGGHALVGWTLPGTDPIHKVTIIPRGRSLGHTQALPTDDRHLLRRSELTDRLAMLLGGRAAEQLIFEDPTTGASNDIEQAAQMARRMVVEYGMSERLGPVQYGRPEAEVFLGRDYTRQLGHSEKTASFVDEEVRRLIEDAQRRARAIVTTHREALDHMAEALMEKETLDSDDVAQIFAGVPPWPGSSGKVTPLEAAPGREEASKELTAA
ncbi:MAG: ATP-dependent zinc metalloprotease FtsH [Acidimicrobiia bacterium]